MATEQASTEEDYVTHIEITVPLELPSERRARNGSNDSEAREVCNEDPFNQIEPNYDNDVQDSFEVEIEPNMEELTKITKSILPKIAKMASCHICNKLFNNRKLMNRHIGRIHKKNMYICDICGKMHHSRELFILHVKFEHLQADPINCPRCGKLYNNKKLLEVHLNKCGKVQACSYCGLEVSARYLKTHIRNIHFSDESKVQCKECGVFLKSGSISNHMKFQHNFTEYLQCQFCEAKLKSQSTLNNHVRAFHSDTNKFYCEVCNKKFNLWSNYTRHRNTVHIESQCIKCELCEKVFKHDLSLKEHMNMAHLKPRQYKCRECGDIFDKPQEVTQHLADVHNIIDTPTCNICGKVFAAYGNLRKHMKKVHKVPFSMKQMLLARQALANADTVQVKTEPIDDDVGHLETDNGGHVGIDAGTNEIGGNDANTTTPANSLQLKPHSSYQNLVHKHLNNLLTNGPPAENDEPLPAIDMAELLAVNLKEELPCEVSVECERQ